MSVPIRVEEGRAAAGVGEAKVDLGWASRSIFRNSFDLLPSGDGLVLLRMTGEAASQICVRTGWTR